MVRICVSDIGQWQGQQVNLCGWIERIRRLGQVNFFMLRDRTGRVQVVVKSDTLDHGRFTNESVIAVKGLVHAEERALGGFEVHAESVQLINRAEPLPLSINNPTIQASLDTQLNHRSVSLRHTRIQPIFRIQAALVHGFQRFLDGEGFTQVFSPKLVASGTEGGTELFSLPYFEQRAYLAQSPQFYKQMLVGAGYERVYEVGPVYRAERHDTARHLNEYISLDLEMGFIRDEHDIMDLQERLLHSMLASAAQESSPALQQLQVELPEVSKIPRIPLSEAADLLERRFHYVGQHRDLDPKGERLLSQYAAEELQSDFLFVTDYPQAKRPMYTMPKAGGTTASFDLLFRGMEITTGGQRIHDGGQLQAALEQRGFDPQGFQHYLEAFRFGMPPHGGLAIGLERLTALLCGCRNIREAALFPRDRHRLTP